MAALSTLYLLFGNAGVVQRSERTCYPIPQEVEVLLKQQCSLESLKNIPATQVQSHFFIHLCLCSLCSITVLTAGIFCRCF